MRTVIAAVALVLLGDDQAADFPEGFQITDHRLDYRLPLDSPIPG